MSTRPAASACPTTASASCIEPKLDLPRLDNGRVDINATAQLLNDVVERWVREDPGQWMWFHKRWKLTPPNRRKNRGKAASAGS